jgi:hypothetical protein
MPLDAFRMCPSIAAGTQSPYASRPYDGRVEQQTEDSEHGEQASFMMISGEFRYKRSFSQAVAVHAAQTPRSEVFHTMHAEENRTARGAFQTICPVNVLFNADRMMMTGKADGDNIEVLQCVISS